MKESIQSLSIEKSMDSPKIKVLQIHTLPIISGSGIHTLTIMKGLDKSRYEVEFACALGGALIDEAVK